METTREGIIAVLEEVYKVHSYLLKGDILSVIEKKTYDTLGQYIDDNKDPKKEITDTTIAWALKRLMSYMERYYGRQVLVRRISIYIELC